MNTQRFNELRRYPSRVMQVAVAVVILTLGAYFTYNFLVIERQIAEANDTILNLINDNIVRSSREVRTFAYNIGYNWQVQKSIAETDIPTLIRNNDNYYQIARMTIDSNIFIDDIAVFTKDLSVFRNLSEEITYIHYKAPLIEYLSGENHLSEIFLTIHTFEGAAYLCCVMPLFELKQQIDTSKPIGYCLTSFSLGKIDSYFRQVGLFKTGYTAIQETQGRVLMSGAPEDSPEINILDILDNPRRYLVKKQRMGAINANLFTILPRWEIRKKQLGFFLFSILLLGILIITIIIVTGKFRNAFSKPLNRFVDQLRKIDGSDRETRIQNIPDNEIGYISRHVNDMLDKIHDMSERMLANQLSFHQMELHKKESELLALQAQINPHFMYNTLECLRSIGLDYNSPETVEISTALADILRYCLGRDYIVTLSQEVEIVREYFKIIDIRFDGRYQFVIDIPEELSESSIIKMILQPLAENAVFHGLENRRSGHLSIVCFREKGELFLQVEDTGNGIMEESLLELQQYLKADSGSEPFTPTHERSIGIANIHNRIRTFYGIEYGLTIESTPEQGTKVTIKLPA